MDHRTTSAKHPVSNGLTERCVQTMKNALAKYTAANASVADWDKYCAWLSLGYNCSPQQSTKLPPYQVLYGRVPSIPSAVREALTALVNFSDPMAVVADVLARGDAVRRGAPTIDENLAIAQHRDTRRYEAVRSGSYVPSPKPLVVGDYVWERRHKTNSTLQDNTMPPVLRVQHVNPEGTLSLIG